MFVLQVTCLFFKVISTASMGLELTTLRLGSYVLPTDVARRPLNVFVFFFSILFYSFFFLSFLTYLRERARGAQGRGGENLKRTAG